MRIHIKMICPNLQVTVEPPRVIISHVTGIGTTKRSKGGRRAFRASDVDLDEDDDNGADDDDARITRPPPNLPPRNT